MAKRTSRDKHREAHWRRIVREHGRSGLTIREIELSGVRRVHVAPPVDRQALTDVLAVLEGLPSVALGEEGRPC